MTVIFDFAEVQQIPNMKEVRPAQKILSQLKY